MIVSLLWPGRAGVCLSLCRRVWADTARRQGSCGGCGGLWRGRGGHRNGRRACDFHRRQRRFTVADVAPGATITATFRGLQAELQIGTETQVALVLSAVPGQQSAVVTATRSALDIASLANTVSTIDWTALTQYPALTLDERLRQQAGFELFRRSSSWVANPTSEGLSLRGLGSTAASRTLVLSDLVPLNDGFGGWIHWNEMPPETTEAVTLASGGGSDLYGSSALGGVIDIAPSRPGPVLGQADLAGSSEDTTN